MLNLPCVPSKKRYGHGLKPVIVKPVNSTKKPFRTTKDGVISSLVGGYEEFPQEHFGSWKSIRCHVFLFAKDYVVNVNSTICVAIICYDSMGIMSP